MSDNYQRRVTILAAAERLLEHYGLTKTTIADIAREASIGVGSVYLEFGSKDDIIAHVARAKHRAILEHLEAIASADGSASQRLHRVLDARVRLFRELAACGTHAPELVHCRCDPVQKSWREYKAAEQALVERLVADGIAAAEFESQDVARAAASVLDAYAVFAPPWQPRSLDDFDARLSAMHGLVLRGLAR